MTRSYHGEGTQAIDWIVNVAGIDDRIQAGDFLACWQQGNLDEWPDFYEWLDAQPTSSVRPEPVEGLLELRPEVAAFAQIMESKLRANEHKGGWKSDPIMSLMTRVHQETAELRIAANAFNINPDRELALNVGCEAADVANMAMMVADVAGAFE